MRTALIIVTVMLLSGCVLTQPGSKALIEDRVAKAEALAAQAQNDLALLRATTDDRIAALSTELANLKADSPDDAARIAELEAEIERIRADATDSMADVEDAVDDATEHVTDARETLENLPDNATAIEGIASVVSTYLPPPWNLLVPSIGALIFGARRNQ